MISDPLTRVAPERERSPRSKVPSFLTEKSLQQMLGWARSHERIFREQAVKEGLATSSEQISESGTYALVLHLLGETGGFQRVRSLIRKGPGKTIEDAVLRSIRESVALPKLHGALTARVALDILVEKHDFQRAAWVIWLSQQSVKDDAGLLTATTGDLAHFDAVMRQHPELGRFIETDAEMPSAGVSPDVNHGPEDWKDLVSALAGELRIVDAPSPALADRLRTAADAVDRAIERRQAEREIERERLKTAFAGAIVRIVASGCKLPALDGMLRSPETVLSPDLSLAKAADVVTLAEQLAIVADLWGKRYREQDFTDIQSFVALTEEARRQAETLAIHHREFGASVQKPAGQADDETDSAASTSEVVDRASYDLEDAAIVPDLRMAAPGSVVRDKVGVSPRTAIPSAGNQVPASSPDSSGLEIYAQNSPDGVDACSRTVDVLMVAEVDGIFGGDREFVEEQGQPIANHSRTAALAAMMAAIGNGRLGLAIQVASALQSAGEPPAHHVDLFLLKALLAGLAVGHPDADRAAGLFEVQVSSILERGGNRAIRLLTLAAALRPALFAFGTGAEELLRGADELRSFGQAIEDVALFCSQIMPRLGARFTPSELAMDQSSRTPRELFDDCCRGLADFAREAPNWMIKFQRATQIWQNVLRQDPVRSALKAAAEGRTDAAAQVESALSRLADIDYIIDREDARYTRGRRAKGLEAGAREKLTEWLADVAERLRTWQRLGSATTHPEPDMFRKKARQDLRAAVQAAYAALAPMRSDDPLTTAALAIACQALDSVMEDFKGRSDVKPGFLLRFDDDILLLPRRWKPEEAAGWSESEREIFFEQVRAEAETRPDYASAFQRALADGRFADALQARDRLAADGCPDPELLRLDDWMVGERDQALGRAVARIRTAGLQLNDLLGADDTLTSRSLVPEIQRLESQVTRAEPVMDLQFWGGEMEMLERQLSDVFDRLVQPLAVRVDVLGGSGADVAELRDLERHRDLTTLAEYLPAYEAGGATAAARPSALLRRFATEALGETSFPSLGPVRAWCECLSGVYDPV